MTEQHLPAPQQPTVVGRTGSAVRSGAVAAARRVLAASSGGSERDTALAQVALGRLLREDGLRGLSHPTDPRLVRPGIGGSLVGVVVAALFTGVPVVGLTSFGLGPFAEEPAPEVVESPFGEVTTTELVFAEPPLDVLVWVVGGFAVLGLLLLVAALVALGGRVRAVLAGAAMERRGRAALAALAGGTTPAVAAAEEEVLERVYPRFAGMLSWTLPRRTGSGLHDHDPFD